MNQIYDRPGFDSATVPRPTTRQSPVIMVPVAPPSIVVLPPNPAKPQNYQEHYSPQPQMPVQKKQNQQEELPKSKSYSNPYAVSPLKSYYDDDQYYVPPAYYNNNVE